MTTLYAGPMPHPTYATSFSQFSVTPYVCAWCHTEACAVNDEDPQRRVLVWRMPASEHVDLPAVEVGVRCLREHVAQTGGPSAATEASLREELAHVRGLYEATAADRDAAALRADALEDEVVQPLLDRITSKVEKGLQVAGIAGANAARKAAGPAA